MNLLFICSRNKWRSPTAENLWRRKPGFNARSAGTAASARRKTNEADLTWADLIIVMEPKHRQQILQQFGSLVNKAKIYILDIPDDYSFMDPELIEIFETAIPSVIDSAKAQV